MGVHPRHFMQYAGGSPGTGVRCAGFVDAGGADADNSLSRHLSVFAVLMTHGFRAPQRSIFHIKFPPFFRCYDAGKST